MADDANTSYQPDILTLAAEITAAYLGKSTHVKAEEIPAIIKSIRSALAETDTPPETDAAPAATGPAPKMHAATVKKSITPDALISFVDNKPYKSLKRHLSRHGHDMKSYREAYGLPSDYPSVAPNYSAARSEMARKIGLGARGRGAAPAPEAEPEVTTAADGAEAPKRTRKQAAV